MTFPVALAALLRKRRHEKGIRVRKSHDKQRHLAKYPRYFGQGITKVNLRLPGAVDQGHVHLPAYTLDLSHRLLHLGVLARITHLFETVVYPRGSVPLLLGNRLVVFDDLGDNLKVGAQLRLGPGEVHPIAGRLWMILDLL